MSANNQPSSAIERARIAFEMMTQRQLDAELQRRLRERSRAVMLVVGLVGTLVVLAGTAAFWLPASVRSSILGLNVDEFSLTRTGQVRSYVKGNTCQQLQFNNERGGYIGGSLVPCDSFETGSASGERIQSVRGAFTSR